MQSIRSIGVRVLLATLLPLALLPLGLGTSAQAFVVGGGITGGEAQAEGGGFVKLTIPFDPPNGAQNAVGNDTFQTPHLYAVDEDQNIVIDETLSVNVGDAPMAGDIVASHYVFFDPQALTTMQGFVDFDSDIYGVATSTGNLAASDLLANTDVVYLNPSARGLESGDFVSIDPEDPRRLWIDFEASTPGDYVRVLTRESVGFDIDIKPHGDTNFVHPRLNLPIPVALLGSEEFDVADIDMSTLVFGPNGAAPALDLTNPAIFFIMLRDANEDGHMDILAHFLTQPTGIAAGDSEACASGETLGGTPFEGCDTVLTTCGPGFEVAFLLPPVLWLRDRRRAAART